MGERLLLVIYLGALLVDLVELVLVGRLNVSIFFGGVTKKSPHKKYWKPYWRGCIYDVTS